ncbi:hypothetical protein [Pseudoxanthomonas broegbernensis]|nr:hypothetical protein [Pseudoxanthomonas broegbernensis]MBB6063539.1 hypothetical protein [Pseudoxanthomonas broegbernensis]
MAIVLPCIGLAGHATEARQPGPSPGRVSYAILYKDGVPHREATAAALAARFPPGSDVEELLLFVRERLGTSRVPPGAGTFSVEFDLIPCLYSAGAKGTIEGGRIQAIRFDVATYYCD